MIRELLWIDARKADTPNLWTPPECNFFDEKKRFALFFLAQADGTFPGNKSVNRKPSEQNLNKRAFFSPLETCVLRKRKVTQFSGGEFSGRKKSVRQLEKRVGRILQNSLLHCLTDGFCPGAKAFALSNKMRSNETQFVEGKKKVPPCDIFFPRAKCVQAQPVQGKKRSRLVTSAL